ncbi:Olfactory receptor 5B21 [Fukomys damarensis]|uniref:Olfactory receptor 5B21 n=1 Tax=Fukomys damarensis TaxID=885580 RepID=A0A091DEM1_FUKDA|nr:Olfactory receptor 5B21 [Fukomys damarensis]
MAYDHHAAECRPLRYITTVTTGVCAFLMVGSYVLNASVHTADTSRLSFCGSNAVAHRFCDIPHSWFSHAPTHASASWLCSLLWASTSSPLLLVLISHLFMYMAIRSMHSAEGWKGAFSTRVSHLTAVSTFYGTIIFRICVAGGKWLRQQAFQLPSEVMDPRKDAETVFTSSSVKGSRGMAPEEEMESSVMVFTVLLMLRSNTD